MKASVPGPSPYQSLRAPPSDTPLTQALNVKQLRAQLRARGGGEVKLFVAGPDGSRTPLDIPELDRMTPDLGDLMQKVSYRDMATRTGWELNNVQAKVQRSRSSAASLSLNDMARFLGALGLWLEGEATLTAEGRTEPLQWKQLPSVEVADWTERPLLFDGLPLAAPPTAFFSLKQIREEELHLPFEDVQVKGPDGSGIALEAEAGLQSLRASQLLAYVRALKHGLAEGDKPIRLELHAIDAKGKRMSLAFKGNGGRASVGFRQLLEHLRMPEAVFQKRVRASSVSLEAVDALLATGKISMTTVRPLLQAINATPQWVVTLPWLRVGVPSRFDATT